MTGSFKRFVLFIFSVLYFSATTIAQQEDNPMLDIFEHEGLLDLKSRDMQSYTASGVLIINKLNTEQYSAIEIKKNLDQSVYIVEDEKVFVNYSTANIDSVIGFLQSGNIAAITPFIDALYLDTANTSMEVFIAMNKRALGNLLDYQLLKRESIFIRSKKRTYGIITLKATFTKGQGILTLYFRLSDTNKFGLAKIAFMPYNKQQNIFVKAIAKNDLNFVQSKNYKMLEHDFTDELLGNIGKKLDKFEKGLEKYAMSDSLFTFRLFTRNRQLFITAVFYTNKPNEFFSMRYALVNKKMMIDQVAIIDQN